ncbi:MAG: 4Fe-4S dicluster domain-containing protein [Planctomycetes bacterium]|nr:4Fe-4S dicluster domain-containing protein [Planctomycetota bacterium]
MDKSVCNKNNSLEMEEKDKIAYNRRQFFRAGIASVVDSVKEIAKKESPQSTSGGATKKGVYIRPPGAVDETAFLSLCTRCDECIKVCPHHSIKRAGKDYGSAAGTPIIVPREKPCYLCDDLPCVKACTTGALKSLTSKEEVRMGVAVINISRCLAYAEQPCKSCVIKCPLSGKAITYDNFKPIIHEDACVGCGVCEHVCRMVNDLCAIKTISHL